MEVLNNGRKNELELTLNIVSVFFGFIAAGCWFASAFARVSVKEEVSDDGWIEATISNDGADLFKSLKRQSNWNALGASFAGIAAFLQAIILIIQWQSKV